MELVAGQAQVSGRFEIIINDTRTGEVTKHLDYQDNLILNSGLNYLGKEEYSLGFLQLGSGNSEPVVTQTLLDFREWTVPRTGEGVASSSFVDLSTPFYSSVINTYFFEMKKNVNISELGLCPVITYNAPLFSRALIKDAQGNPVSITVKDYETVTVNYEVRQYYDASTYNYTVPVNVRGTVRNFNVKRIMYDIDNPLIYTKNTLSSGEQVMVGGRSKTRSNNTLPVQFYWLYQEIDHLTELGSNQYNIGIRMLTNDRDSNGNALIDHPYVDNSYERTATLTMGVANSGATRGIIVFSSRGHNIFIFSDLNGGGPLPKTVNDKLDLNVTYSWGRYVAP